MPAKKKSNPTLARARTNHTAAMSKLRTAKKRLKQCEVGREKAAANARKTHLALDKARGFTPR